MNQYLKLLSILLLVGMMILGSSCGDSNGQEEEPKTIDPLLRAELLTHIAESLILPASIYFSDKTEQLVETMVAYNQDLANIDQLRGAFISAYEAWQYVAIYDIGYAEQTGMRNYINVYPTDLSQILSNITSDAYNLDLPSNFVAQGFPAVEYLIYRPDLSVEQMEDVMSGDYLAYVSTLISKINRLAHEQADYWMDFGNRATFVREVGSSATSSFDKLVNDFLFYYERHFRAGKVGIPAGVFSGNIITHSVEAFYSGNSKRLFEAAFDAIQKFFEGTSYDGRSTGPSLKTYLEDMQELNSTIDVASAILDKWSAAEEKLLAINDRFDVQIESDNVRMLELYDEIQGAVVLLKVDMLQALNIQVDYVDADGD